MRGRSSGEPRTPLLTIGAAGVLSTYVTAKGNNTGTSRTPNSDFYSNRSASTGVLSRTCHARRPGRVSARRSYVEALSPPRPAVASLTRRPGWCAVTYGSSHACLQSPLIEIQSPLLEVLLKPKHHRLQYVVHVEDAARQLPELLRGCMRSTSRGTPRYSVCDEMMMRWWSEMVIRW